MSRKPRTTSWCNRAALLHGITAGPMLGIMLSLAACGSHNVASEGCYVNGYYYPNGNAPNGQCTCPPIGPCTITFPTYKKTKRQTRTATVIKPISTVRSSYTATRMANGQVLVVGGLSSSDIPLASAELYNPATDTFTTTGSLSVARYNHTANLLANGQVLVVGGLSSSDSPLASTEIYDPATGAFILSESASDQ